MAIRARKDLRHFYLVLSSRGTRLRAGADCPSIAGLVASVIRTVEYPMVAKENDDEQSKTTEESNQHKADDDASETVAVHSCGHDNRLSNNDDQQQEHVESKTFQERLDVGV